LGEERGEKTKIRNCNSQDPAKTTAKGNFAGKNFFQRTKNNEKQTQKKKLTWKRLPNRGFVRIRKNEKTQQTNDHQITKKKEKLPMKKTGHAPGKKENRHKVTDAPLEKKRKEPTHQKMVVLLCEREGDAAGRVKKRTTVCLRNRGDSAALPACSRQRLHAKRRRKKEISKPNLTARPRLS